MLFEIDLNMLIISRSIDLPTRRATSVAVKDNQIFVSDPEASRILVYSKDSLALMNSWPIDGVPYHISIPPIADGLYVCTWQNDTSDFFVLDLTTGDII
jgi:hypothetical protein